MRISITLGTNLDPLARSCHPWKHGSWGQHGAKLGLTGPRWAPCWPHKPCCLGYWDVTTINFSQLTHRGQDKMTAIFQTTFSNCIFLNENVWISIKISLKFVPNGPINIIPALFQIMACCWPGDKPLSEQLMVILSTYICVTQPQWVKLVLQLVDFTTVSIR